MTHDARPLLVFFWSERSGPARRMESLLAHLARKERARLRVFRVDIDAQPEVAERFKVLFPDGRPGTPENPGE